MPQTIYDTFVPNEGPMNAEFLVVGEAPGFEEEQGIRKSIDENGEPVEVIKPGPFLGKSGELLLITLRRYGLKREDIRLCNLFNYRPASNRFEYIVAEKKRLDASIVSLYQEIQTIKPKVILALGAWPLYYMTGLSGSKPGSGIIQWRGSILPSTVGAEIKVIPTFHPAYCLRSGVSYPAFDKDVQRAVGELKIDGLQYPEREYIIDPSVDTVEYWVKELSKAEYLTVDIETKGPTLACVGFSDSQKRSIVFQYKDHDFVTNDAIMRILASPAKKILQYGWFDINYLESKYGWPVTNYAWDTYIGQQTLDPELPRTLAYMASIHTRQPYYKEEYKESGAADTKVWGKRIDMQKLMTYNGKDTSCTFEIFEFQRRVISEDERLQRTFDFQMDCVRELAFDLSKNGMLVDMERNAELKEALKKEWSQRQAYLDLIAGFHVNVNSVGGKNATVPRLLYDTLSFRKRTKRGSSAATTDEVALMAMLAEAKKEYDTKIRPDAKLKWLHKLMAVKLILIIRGIRKKLSSYIDITISDDNRARSMYIVGGTETGRWAAKKWIDDTGYNAMTTPRDYVEVELEPTRS